MGSHLSYLLESTSAVLFHIQDSSPLWIVILLITTSLTVTLAFKALFLDFVSTYQDCSTTGFEDEGESKSLRKRAAINEARKKTRDGHWPYPYPNGWFAILDSSDLKAGTSKAINVLGCNLVGWRGTSGQMYVADAYCPHLGAHLGVGSRVLGETIECPFHSWCFDGTKGGNLCHIPYTDKRPANTSVRMWKTVEIHDTIFLWHHVDGEDPTWYPEQFDALNDLKYRGKIELQMATALQDLTENGADFVHLNELHTDVSNLGDNPWKWRWLRDYARHWHVGGWNVDPEEKHKAHLKGTHYLRIGNKWDTNQMSLHSIYIGPGIVHVKISSPMATFAVLQTMTPKEPFLQTLTAKVYCSKYLPNPGVKNFVKSFTAQLVRDVRVLNRKTYLERPTFLSEDKGIVAFRRWHSQFYSSTNANRKEGLDF